jgi:uncharacterized membrane protein (UPF0127 family)
MSPRAETPRRRVSAMAALFRSALSLCILAAIAMLAACGGTAHAPTPIPTGSDGAPLTRLTFVNKDGCEVDLLVETVDDSAERARGLMFRESLPEDQGMLFVFEQEGQHTFYMRDTLIPLSIAFIEGEGEILEIEDMEPLDETLHSADEPYLYAIEANQGWFGRNGIAPGSEVRIARTASTLTPTGAPTP